MPMKIDTKALRLTDAEFEALKASMNSAIHEIVFAAKHAEEDQYEEAAQCLMTAQGTLDQVAERIVAAGG